MLLGALLALGCALCWLLANVTIREPSRRLGALGALLRAQLFALPLALPLAFVVEGAPPSFDLEDALVVLVGAGAAAAAYWGLFAAIGTGRLAVVTPIVSSWSALAVVAGLVVFDERPHALGWSGIALLLAGSALLVLLEGRGATPAPFAGRAALAASVSAVGFAVMASALKALAASSGPIWSVIAIWSVELLLLAAVALLRPRSAAPAPRSAGARLLGRAILPGVLELAGFVLLALASRRAPLAVVGPISSLAAALTVLWGIVVLGERLPRIGWLGAAAAALGVVLVSL